MKRPKSQALTKGAFSVLVVGFLLLASIPVFVSNAGNATIIRGTFSNELADPYRPRIYLANSATNSLSILNTNTNSLIANISVGPRPAGMDISANGNELYLALTGSNSLAVVNLNNLTLSRTIGLSAQPFDVASGRQGRVYVTTTNIDSQGSFVGGSGYPLAIDTNDSREIGNITSGGLIYNGATGRTSPDRETFYVGETSIEPSTIYKFSVATDNITLQSRSPSDSGLAIINDIKFSPDGRRLYISANSPNAVQVVNATDWNAVGALPTETSPTSLSIVQGGGIAFVVQSYPAPNQLIAFDTATFQPIAYINTEGVPVMIASSQDGSTAYVLEAQLGGLSGNPGLGLEVVTTQVGRSLQASSTSISCPGEIEPTWTFNCTAKVTPASATGTVYFETSTSGGTTFSHHCTLAAGSCNETFSYAGDVSGGGIAPVTIEATYEGDANFAPSISSPVVVNVVPTICNPGSVSKPSELCFPQIQGSAFQIAYDGNGSAWVAVGLGSGTGLYRINLTTALNSPSTSISPVGQPFPFSGGDVGNYVYGPIGVTIINGTLYSSAVYNVGDAIAVTNPITNDTKFYFFPNGSGSQSLLSTDGQNIYRAAGNEILAFSPTSHNTTIINVSPCIPVTIDPQGQLLWITCDTSNGLAVVDKNGSGLHLFNYGNRGAFSYVDSIGDVWFTISGGQNPSDTTSNSTSTISTVDAGHSLVECVQPCAGNATFVTYPTDYSKDGPMGIVFDPSRNGLWVSGYSNYNVMFFNFTSKSFVGNLTIQTDKRPYMGFVDSTGAVWNLALGSTNLVRIPPAEAVNIPPGSLTSSTTTGCPPGCPTQPSLTSTYFLALGVSLATFGLAGVVYLARNRRRA